LLYGKGGERKRRQKSESKGKGIELWPIREKPRIVLLERAGEEQEEMAVLRMEKKKKRRSSIALRKGEKKAVFPAERESTCLAGEGGGPGETDERGKRSSSRTQDLGESRPIKGRKVLSAGRMKQIPTPKKTSRRLQLGKGRESSTRTVDGKKALRGFESKRKNQASK